MKIETWHPTTVLAELLTDIDTKALAEYAYFIKDSSEGRTVTNFNGWQSNDLDLEDPAFEKLLKAVDQYSNILHQHLNFRKDTKQVVDNMWININPRGGSNKLHAHGESCISGVFYIKCNKDSGKIVLPHPAANFIYNTPEIILEEYTERNSQFCEHSPQEGKILMFPSWVYHYVEANMSEEDRISIAFNTKVTPILQY